MRFNPHRQKALEWTHGGSNPDMGEEGCNIMESIVAFAVAIVTIVTIGCPEKMSSLGGPTLKKNYLTKTHDKVSSIL